MSEDERAEEPNTAEVEAAEPGPSVEEARELLGVSAEASFQELGLARQALLRKAQQVYDPGIGKRIHDAYDRLLAEGGGAPTDPDPVREDEKKAFEDLARQANEALSSLGDEAEQERRQALASQAARAAAGTRLKAYLARERAAAQS